MDSLIWELQLRKSNREQVENTAGDSFELYYGLFMYNPNATEEVRKGPFCFPCEIAFRILLQP